MKKLILACLMVASVFSCKAADDVIDVEKFSPTIVATTMHVDAGWDVGATVSRLGMNPFQPTVDSYNHKGQLIASWNPSEDVANRPTFILMHGGHGIASGDMDNAYWLQKTYGANVLILDSYWSRGRHENWSSQTIYGPNMRVLDALAAAKFTKAQGADPAKTFLMGDSQGGWTVLRAFTEHNMASEVRSLFAGGIALYPNCYTKKELFHIGPVNQMAPPLGPYKQPIIIFTGTADTATPTSVCDVDRALKSAESWTVFEGATHAWDQPTNGAGRPSIDGVCTTAANVYNHFKMCRSNEYTLQMRATIENFLISKNAMTADYVAQRKLAAVAIAKQSSKQHTFVAKPISDADRDAEAKRVMDAVGFK
ncbi:hypothetical protein [Flavobacterium sp.]|uniref:alpha/beta hydrolase family protein n=1 Tax=Flavobacterium sp. TaxID=239 RepID=UPI0032646BA3